MEIMEEIRQALAAQTHRQVYYSYDEAAYRCREKPFFILECRAQSYTPHVTAAQEPLLLHRMQVAVTLIAPPAASSDAIADLVMEGVIHTLFHLPVYIGSYQAQPLRENHVFGFLEKEICFDLTQLITADAPEETECPEAGGSPASAAQADRGEAV